jgi:sulfatase maturation enzyme AslB (radical SAM superfamily)
LQTGLDHVLFLLQPGKGESWQALERLMPEDLFVTVHITLNPQNANKMQSTLQRLVSLGVKNISASIMEMSLRPELEDLARKAAELDLTMRFDLPVPYSAQNPVALETEPDDVPSGAGNAWLYVEPDGDVLPAQGMAEHILGNFLTDKWETIYSH